jgi:membrane-associated protein
VLHEFIEFITHLDKSLPQFINDHGNMIYGLLFLIIFVETGLVIMPFLPGDSLLFTAGALAAADGNPLSMAILVPLLFVAAVAGDNLNYVVGRFAGHRAMKLRIGKRNLVKEEWITKTHVFFEKYGTKAIILARFVPIIRTITPFVAGVGEMDYRKKFLPFDIAGGLLWITSMLTCGYLFGNLPWVKAHFEMVVVGIIGISVLPMVIGYIQARRKKA